MILSPPSLTQELISPIIPYQTVFTQLLGDSMFFLPVYILPPVARKEFT